MPNMKKWQVRSLVIIILGILGMVALAFRPALVPDAAVWETETPQGLVLRPQYDENRAEWEEEYRWELKNSPTHTVFLHERGVDAFTLLEGNPAWVLRFKVHNGTAVLDGDLPELHCSTPHCQLHAHFSVFPSGTGTLRLPNGKVHFQRKFLLVCELLVTPSCWGEPLHSIAAQQMVVDFHDNAMDLVEPQLPHAFTRGMQRVDVVSAHPTGLPERFCGNACERELTRYLYQLAAIDRKAAAELLLPRLEARGQELIDCFADTAKPWPDCWGDAADTARTNARRIIPLLMQFKEAHAHGSQRLADFVNGPVFSRIFGEPLMEIKLQEEEQPKAQPETPPAPPAEGAAPLGGTESYAGNVPPSKS